MSKASICEYFVCQSHWNFSTMLQFFSIPMPPMRLSVGTQYSQFHSCCITAALYALQSVTCVLMYSSGNLNLIWALRARYSNCFNSLFDEPWTEVGYSSVGINFQADCCWIFIAAELETWARFSKGFPLHLSPKFERTSISLAALYHFEFLVKEILHYFLKSLITTFLCQLNLLGDWKDVVFISYGKFY